MKKLLFVVLFSLNANIAQSSSNEWPEDEGVIACVVVFAIYALTLLVLHLVQRSRARNYVLTKKDSIVAKIAEIEELASNKKINQKVRERIRELKERFFLEIYPLSHASKTNWSEMRDSLKWKEYFLETWKSEILSELAGEEPEEESIGSNKKRDGSSSFDRSRSKGENPTSDYSEFGQGAGFGGLDGGFYPDNFLDDE